MENSKIAALVELGILCRGEPVEVCGDGSLDVGPHRYSAHDQLCQYENPSYQHPFEDASQTAYSLYPENLSIQSAIKQTRFVVMLGIVDSVELRTCLSNPNTILVVCEPDERVLTRFLESVRLAGLNRKNLFCFTGDPYSFNPALQDLLPGDMFKVGTPAFFMTDRIREEYGSWAKEFIEYFEILHYRHVIYPLSGQSFARSRPVREIHRGLMYDQQLHLYENIEDFLVSPSIAHIRNRALEGGAILVAAGPDLPEKYEYIRRNRHKAVIICVNNAIKPLVEAGIHPHFVIINDTSIESGQVFKHIPELPGTILVGHCMSDLGGDRFGKKFLFGNFLPNLFGDREMLKLHGSVISTAFSLARHLGCTKCALVGAQLASANPWGLGYAKGTVKGELGREDKPLVNRHPQLYPVTTPFGEQLYTTLNFRDAALWLGETIRLSGIECINTSRSSILYGRGIAHDPEPDLGEKQMNRIMADLFRADSPRVDRDAVKHFLRHEIQMWTSIRDAAAMVLADSGSVLVAKGMAILGQLDKNNVTYLVQRFADFNNGQFHAQVFQGDEATRQEGLKYYFKYVCRMCDEFLAKLNVAVRSL
nr:6-hydroxymethylpterin diphosphokinase MptE-like protein [uncultured Pseudodesulfovibrio sp.]